MAKWEYLFVKCEQDRNDNWHPRHVNGTEIKGWDRGPDIPAYTNQLGKEGWELLHIHIDTIAVAGAFGGLSAHAKESSYRLFFKRPLE